MLEKVYQFCESCHIIAVGGFFIVLAFLIKIFFTDSMGDIKPGKVSKDELEYMSDCIRKAEKDLNSQKYGDALSHHKKLQELITRVSQEGLKRRNRKLRPKLAIIEYEARQCKKRIEEKVKVTKK